MSKLFDLIGGDEISAEERCRILDVLFDERPVYVATGAMVLASVFGWRNGLTGWAMTWAGSAFVVLIGRILLARAYRARAADASELTWKAVFLVACLITGLQWGAGALAFLHTSDSAILCTVFAVQTALMAGASARACCFPPAALTQVGAASLIIAVCAAMAGVWVFVCLMILFMAYYTSFVQSLSSLNLKQILSEQQRKILLASLERTNAEIAEANARLQEISLTDALTGIANRRSFDEEIAVFWAQAARQQTSIALLFIDVDHFKRFNDSHGHLAGDACLTLVAAAIKSAIRGEADRLSRYGGEEFAILLLDTDATEAAHLADRVTKAVRAISVPVGHGRSTCVTVSIGVAAMVPNQDMPSAMLVSFADQAVYLAKTDGRNCVRLSETQRHGALATTETASLAPGHHETALDPHLLGAA